MNYDQIINKCHQQQNKKGNPDAVVLFLMRGNLEKGTLVELFDYGPVGEVIDKNWDGKGMRVVFKADELIKGIEKLQQASFPKA